MYEDNTFDVTLVLGPLYHLYDERDINKAIEESIRVTKKNGKIFFAYITDDAVVLSFGLRKGNLEKLKKISDEQWNIKKIQEEIFATHKVQNFDELMKNYDITNLETIAADGIAPNMADYINNLTNEEFELYIDYHLKNCNRKDFMY